MASSTPTLRFDDFELDESNARLTQGGQPVDIAPRAFAVLAHLAQRPGRLVTKNELLDGVWGHRHVSESVLKTAISQVRAALADDAREPRFIETVSRRGYRFIALSREGPSDPASTASLPQPGDSLLVGREEPLAALQDCWRAATEGRPQMVWVTGEAGVGKTTLLDGFITALPDVVCARGQCIEQVGAGEPYLPILEALGMLCRMEPAVVPMLRSVAPTWLLQLPWLLGEADREALQREVSASSQARMLREFTELLDRYTQRQPLLIVIEDLHWSDHATVQLVDHMARRRNAARLMLLASFRPADLIALDHPLKRVRHELRLHRLCVEIALSPFSETEVADYVRLRGALPDEPAEALARRLHAHTDGLPLFVASIVEDLLAQERSGLAPEAVWTVPHSLAGVIEQQIGRLPVELREILEAASVAGLEFRAETVALALDRDPLWLRERCEGLVRNQYWLTEAEIGLLPDGSLDARFAFRHTLYRTVFHQRMGNAQRARLHRAIGRAMESARAAGIPAAAAELARHAELGHDPVTALRWYAQAAAEAMALHAPLEASELTGHALRVLPACTPGRQRDELELAVMAQRGIALAQTRGAAAPEAIEAYERAQALCELLPFTRERAWVLNGIGWVHYSRGDFTSAEALAERILTLAGEQDDAVLRICGCNLMGVTHVYLGRLDSGIAFLQQGIAACEALGDEGLRGHSFLIDPAVSMLSNLVLPFTEQGRIEEARQANEAALQRADRLGAPINRMLALWSSGFIHKRLRQPEALLDCARELALLVQEHSLAQGEGPSRWLSGLAQIHLGDPREAHRLIHEGYAFHARLQMHAGASHVLGGAVEALIAAGDIDAAAEELDAAIALIRRIDERVGLPHLLLLRATILRRRGETAAMTEVLRESLQESRRQRAAWTEREALAALREAGEVAH